MNRGGKRAGAGRPTAQAAAQKRAAATKDVAARFHERAAKDFDRIYDALSDLAFGVLVASEEDGRVYRRPPDRGALQTMIDHLKGRPATQSVTQPDTIFHFHAAHVPRPGKARDGGRETSGMDEGRVGEVDGSEADGGEDDEGAG